MSRFPLTLLSIAMLVGSYASAQAVKPSEAKMARPSDTKVARLSETKGAEPSGAKASGRDQARYVDKVLLEREKREEAERDAFLAATRGTSALGDEKAPARALSLDFVGLDRPKDPKEFKQLWHQPPKRQWWTNTCWSFSTTSFLESEIKRTQNKEIKLSELWPVYWDYVEKVREFVRTKGTSLVDEGSESEAVLLRWKQYGIVRESDYTGLVGGAKVLNHGLLIQEVRAYIEFLKKGPFWDESPAIAGLRVILDKHLGRPPERITVDGREMTPTQYLSEVVKLNPDDYVEFMSFMYTPFWTKDEYKVPDNWWHSKEYHNLPLDDWYTALKGAVQAGYSVCLGGDVSEPGYEGMEDVAIIPSFDIPQNHIDQSAREFRFYNKTTEDDHGIHIVGYLRKGDHDWFLIKDSARSAQRGVPGYYFYRDDYVRLKMLTFLVHKDAVKPILAKFGTGPKP